MYPNNVDRVPPTNLNWCEYNQKNKPQGNAVATEVMLSFSSGIILATILFTGDLKRDEWVENHSNTFILMSAVSFFAGAIIGAVIASYLVKIAPKKKIKHVPIVAFYLTGILLASLPDNASIIMVARILSGIGYGFIQLTFIVHCSEVSVNRLRGMFLNTFNLCLGAGMIVGSAFMMTNQTNTGLAHYRCFGIFMIVYTCLAHIFLFCFNIESPVLLLQNGDVVTATQNMMKLRNESMETWDIRNDISEFKAMLVEDSQCDKQIWTNGNSRPLLILICTKVLLVLSFNYPLNMLRINTVDGFFKLADFSMAGMFLLSLRLIIACFTLFTVDRFGRRFHLLYGGVSAGAIAILFSVFLFLFGVNEGTLITPTIFCFLFETLPVFMYGVSDTLSGEAFPIVKKPQSIAFLIVIENIVQAILLVSTYHLLFDVRATNLGDFYAVPLVLGLALLLVTYVCFKYVPETTKLSIRETKNLFRGSPQTTIAGIWYSA
ncbi:uncharacterized protein LOC134835795 [Culicoides brevitarsis]|uniref:uncharacterized protein LOC134835795 n=1 Tax=Culicoides brevitarsis TaxID=469753 RepID=UPI00307CBE51